MLHPAAAAAATTATAFPSSFKIYMLVDYRTTTPFGERSLISL